MDAEDEIEVIMFSDESVFRLSYPSRLGTHIAFVAEEVAQAVSPQDARKLHSSPFVLSKVRGWIDKCNLNHSDCIRYSRAGADVDTDVTPVPEGFDSGDSLYGRLSEKFLSNFRLLDLEAGCLRRAVLDEKYVALSYVWGQTSTVLLQRENKKLLSKPGGLGAIRGSLPKTINDAIDLVARLGERCLWVDALCLVQDDVADVELGISLMHSIYQGAYFTIIAGYGSDADAGIPRLNTEGSSNAQLIETLKSGLRIAVVRSIDWHLSRSVYNQRGWTLQELVLPARSLIFIHDRVYFRCQEANWGEDIWADVWTTWLDSDDYNISRIPDWTEGRVPSLWAYQKLCEDYSLRKLRNDGDALRAMAGVSRQLFVGMKSPGIEGLPAYYLDNFLLFYSSNASLRRRSQFASFSWAGWEGRIMFPRENYTLYEDGVEKWDPANILKWLKIGRLVKWAALSTDGFVQELASFTTAAGRVPIHDWNAEFPGAVGSQSQVPSSNSSYSLGSQSQLGAPDWDQDWMINDEMRDNDLITALDAAVGQAEYERIIRSVVPHGPRVKFMLQNYLAARISRYRKARKSSVESEAAVSLKRNWETFHYRFRPARLARDSPEENARLANDPRVKAGTSSKAQAILPESVLHEPSSADLPIPRFPPYPVLEFQTVSLHLFLGDIVSKADFETNKGTMPTLFDRVPAIPLRRNDGAICGWLHADNLDLLSEPGSAIELIILSRCQNPSVKAEEDKAVFAEAIPGAPVSGPWRLLWVLHIVWQDGIAERRGVGQILESALSNPTEPLPRLKTIYLG
ncbi:HET-domain-containing protein [Paramyrothecium foliicola]|nr:HET-domain-containing protein [Paramyrothecium foliicola]